MFCGSGEVSRGSSALVLSDVIASSVFGKHMRSFVISCLWCTLAAGLSPGQETSESQQILKVPAHVMAGRLLTTVTPESPTMRKCSNAMVSLDVVIGEDGKVRSLKVVSGFEDFKQSATTAVKWWTYKPYLENGVPIPVETTVLVFYPSVGKPGPLFVPDGKGGAKGGNFAPMPPECGPPIEVKPTPKQ
jgi:Gram-negative bacterial TonB protein C-terminal